MGLLVKTRQINGEVIFSTGNPNIQLLDGEIGTGWTIFGWQGWLIRFIAGMSLLGVNKKTT